MQVKIPVPGVILITNESQFELAYAFMRLQEFYEHRDISRQGKYYTLDEVIESYRKVGPSGKFSYLEDWAGFNVPSNVVEKFKKLYGHDFTARETELFDTIDKVLAQESNARHNGKYYVIGTYSALYEDHELCHAMWYLYPEFKRDSQKIIKKFSKTQREAVYKLLKEMGYAENVFDDEFNAYVATSDMYYIKESVFEHFVEKGNSKWSWDKIYLLVKNYWEWRNELQIDEDEQEIKLT